MMITDDPKDMETKLTQYVKDAREALETLEAIHPEDTIARGKEYEQYIKALNKLNTARVWLGMAAEQLHDLLNNYNDRMIYAGREEEWEYQKDDV